MKSIETSEMTEHDFFMCQRVFEKYPGNYVAIQADCVDLFERIPYNVNPCEYIIALLDKYKLDHIFSIDVHYFDNL